MRVPRCFPVFNRQVLVLIAHIGVLSVLAACSVGPSDASVAPGARNATGTAYADFLTTRRNSTNVALTAFVSLRTATAAPSIGTASGGVTATIPATASLVITGTPGAPAPVPPLPSPPVSPSSSAVLPAPTRLPTAAPMPVPPPDAAPTSAMPTIPSQTGAPRNPVGTVVDPYGAFWFSLPTGWQVQQPPPREDALQRNTDVPGPYATLATEDVQEGFTLDEYVRVSLARVQQSHPQYRLIPDSVRSITMGGKPARTYNLLSEQGETRIRVTQSIMLDANRAYVLTVIAPEAEAEAVIAQAQIVVDTFTFTAP